MLLELAKELVYFNLTYGHIPPMSSLGGHFQDGPGRTLDV